MKPQVSLFPLEPAVTVGAQQPFPVYRQLRCGDAVIDGLQPHIVQGFHQELIAVLKESVVPMDSLERIGFRFPVYCCHVSIPSGAGRDEVNPISASL